MTETTLVKKIRVDSVIPRIQQCLDVNTIVKWSVWTHRRSQGVQRDHGLRIYSISCCYERRCPKQNTRTVARLKSKYLAPKLCLGWPR